MQHTDEITKGITYGAAAAALARHILEQHGLRDNSAVFNAVNTFRQLTERCPFLTESMFSAIAEGQPGDIETNLASIVTFFNADLFYDQLIELTKAVISISASEPMPQGPADEILQRITQAVESIEDPQLAGAETGIINRLAKSKLDAALTEMQQLTEITAAMRREAGRIESVPNPEASRKTKGA